jgi:hypothetical protein
VWCVGATLRSCFLEGVWLRDGGTAIVVGILAFKGATVEQGASIGPCTAIDCSIDKLTFFLESFALSVGSLLTHTFVHLFLDAISMLFVVLICQADVTAEHHLWNG